MALPLLIPVRMTSTKKYKIMAIVPRNDGNGDYFLKCGIGFENKDASINMFIESLPLAGMGAKGGLKLQLREWDEAEDQRRRDSYRAGSPAGASGTATLATAASEAMAF